MEYTLYYSVHNGGDGSAYPIFLESQELASWDQDHQSEGWGEDCSGTVKLESVTPIVCDQVISKEKYYIKYIKDGASLEEIKEFISKFFPDGVPHFSVRGTSRDAYFYREVYLKDELICTVWKKKSVSNQEVEEFLNSTDEA